MTPLVFVHSLTALIVEEIVVQGILVDALDTIESAGEILIVVIDAVGQPLILSADLHLVLLEQSGPKIHVDGCGVIDVSLGI